ncbi:DUF58 domain-containing protein [Candidatus Pacearchaeota archaeon]|nr:DUF58 domain-containing protein [Candidatus Pacearchaeota archaeon]
MKKLNVDFPKAISRFESIMKTQLLIRTVYYKRIFGGKGFEFDSYRNYSPENDDASLIDWKATMRNPHKVLIRQYLEERDLKIFFIVDVGDNMVFGSGEKLKNEATAELVSSLSHLILGSGDSAGMALYSDRVVKLFPASGGMEHFHSIIRALANPDYYSGKSDLKKTLKFLLPVLKGISAVFIISDFINFDDETIKILKTFMRKFETIGLMIRDPVDLTMPDLDNEVIIEDIYTGEQKIVNPKMIKRDYEKYTLEQVSKVDEVFTKTGSDLLELHTDKDFLLELATLLKSRVKKRKFVNS